MSRRDLNLCGNESKHADKCKLLLTCIKQLKAWIQHDASIQVLTDYRIFNNRRLDV